MNSTLFTGHRPWPVLLFSFLAWAVRPTPPQKRRKGMQRSRFITASRYFLASFRLLPFTAAAVSRVFCTREQSRRQRGVGRERVQPTLHTLKCTRRSQPRALQLVADSDALLYFTIAPARGGTEGGQPGWSRLRVDLWHGRNTIQVARDAERIGSAACVACEFPHDSPS